MSRGSKSKVESAHSCLLSLPENEKLEELLGRRCAVSSVTREGRCEKDIVLYMSSVIAPNRNML